MKSAEQGYAEAQFEVGNYYSYVKEDKKQAFEWYLESAVQGFDKAQLKVSQCYAFGIGTHEDLVASEAWETLVIKNRDTE